jgi:hypothetical protein
MNESAVKAAILDAHCFKFRYGMFEQERRLAALLGITNDEVVRRILRQLVADGHLGSAEALAKPLLDLREPIYRFPDDGEPDDAAHAWILQRRWAVPLRPTRIYFATPRCRRILGGVLKSDLTSQSQLSHDLHLASIWLTLAETAPALARAWVHEDELEGSYEKGEPRPDAIIFDGRKPALAIEFGGGYSAHKLAVQRRGCARRKLPFELW